MDTNAYDGAGSPLVAAFEKSVDEATDEQARTQVKNGSPNPAIAESDSLVTDTPNENLLPNISRANSSSNPNNVYHSTDRDSESGTEVKKPSLLAPASQFQPIKYIEPCWPEGLACLGVLFSLVAIYITLRESNTKPLPQLPFSVSINTVVSFESTIFKGCLTFVISMIINQSQWLWFAKNRSLYDVVRYDAAGRGPWGSFLWIWEHHIRSLLTSVGAILMILTILVDPFIQELIGYVDCQIEMKTSLHNATISRTNYYAPELYHLDMGAVDVKIPTPVQDSIFAGVEGTPTSIEFDCFTGNCTFSKSYSSAGYCHYCEDTSSQVKFSETCDPRDCQTALNITSYLPDNFSITSSTYGAFPDNEFTTARTPLMAMNPTEPFVELLVAKTVRSGCGPSPANKTWACQGYGAARCMLGPCVRTYNASINNNIISEILIDNSDPQLEWGLNGNPTGIPGDNTTEFLNGLVDLHCVSQADKRKLVNQNYTFNSSVRWLPYSFDYDDNVNASETPPFPGSMLADGCVYLFQTFFVMSMWDVFFMDFYSGTLLGTVQGSDQLINTDGPRLLEITYDTANGSFETINSTFASMATYLTNYIRQNGHPLASEPAQGNVLHYATCVEVRWRWLAFPFTLAGVTIVLFVWIVLVVARTRMPLWKSSPLAFIFRGPMGSHFHEDDIYQLDTPTTNKPADTLNHLEAISRSTIVRLCRTSEGLRLEDTTVSSLDTTRIRRTRFD
jgi:hypothetical protein